MMTIRFNPSGLWPQRGRAFNHGVLQPEGRVLHITGQVAWDEDGQIVGKGDAEEQMRMSFRNVARILEAVGGELHDIVSLTIYFLQRADLPAVQKVRSEYFTAANAPASILIQTPGLVIPELLVELVPIAVVPQERYRDPI